MLCVSGNYSEAARVTPRRMSDASSSPGSPSLRKGFGEVPAYLLERKAAAAEEERKRAAERADDCPAG